MITARTLAIRAHLRAVDAPAILRAAEDRGCVTAGRVYDALPWPPSADRMFDRYYRNASYTKTWCWLPSPHR